MSQTEKENHLEFLRALDWQSYPEFFDFHSWEEDFGLVSEDPYLEYFEHYIGKFKRFELYDPNEVLSSVVSAMNYSIAQVNQKNYQDVLEMNELLTRVSFWIDGDAGEFFDNAVILEFFWRYFPTLNIPMDEFGMAAFAAVYNTSSKEERPAKIYDFLYEYADSHWDPFTLVDLWRQRKDELPDWETFLPALNEEIKTREKYSGRVSTRWDNDLYRMLNGDSKYIRWLIEHQYDDLHITEKGAEKIRNKLHLEGMDDYDLVQWCIEQLLADETDLSFDPKETKIIAAAPSGTFTVTKSTRTISLTSQKSVRKQKQQTKAK